MLFELVTIIHYGHNSDTNCFLSVHFSAVVKAGGWCVGLIVLNLIVPCILGKESTMDGAGESYMDFWVVRLAVNLLGYATIFVPGWLMIRYLRKVRYDETAGKEKIW